MSTSGYTPIPGDIIYFSSSANVNKSSHVGIVVGVDNDFVYAVEGNTSDKVAARKYKKTCSKIIGYGIWSGAGTNKNYASEYSSLNASGLKHDGYVGNAYSDNGGGGGTYGSSGGSGGGGMSGQPRDSYQGNYGMLEAKGSIYYQDVGPAPSAGVQPVETTVVDPDTGQEKTVTVMQEIYEYVPSGDPEDVNDEDFSVAVDSELPEKEYDLTALEVEEDEKIRGINFQDDGSYKKGEYKDAAEIVKKFEAFS